nr:type II toxin-antitoxin system VapC family toxin [uncultured Rhodopila sp.]
MRLLLDRHLLLWAVAEPHRLDATTQAALEDPENEVLFSASIWEIAIKARLGRPDFAFRLLDIMEAALEIGFLELTVRARAAALVAKMPLLHRDPFDRLLIARAITEPARFYTAEGLLPPYSELVTLVG